MKRLLWIGDAACDSGFARATHNTLETLRHHFDVAVLGVNYRGDPSPYQSLYRMYPARNVGTRNGGDVLGISRMAEILDLERPDVVVVQNDPWHAEVYLNKLREFAPYARVVGAMAIDGLNCMYGPQMNGFDHTIFWTKFASQMARIGGYTKSASVIPLGVTKSIYEPGDRLEARRTLRLPTELDDAFIFLNVNRNQPRKRIDLTIRYFAHWLRQNPDVTNAYLYLHVCPTGDVGVEVEQLARYYECIHRVITATPPVYRGVSESLMAATYRAANVIVSTTTGEGFGLTALEGMACGLPALLPGWSALAELFHDAAYLVKCTSTVITPQVNVIGGVADEDEFIAGMNLLYRNSNERETYVARSLAKAAQPCFDWTTIGGQWLHVLERVLAYN
jgi:D-inositol-3-phosphate glycosyltransferase